MALCASRRGTLATLVAALLVTLGAACNNGGSQGAGRPVFRSGAVHPYVRYLAGPRNDALDVSVDLDSKAVRIGRGSLCDQTVTQASLDESDLAEGRRLFSRERIQHYQETSADAEPLGSGGQPSGMVGTPEEPEGGSGIPADGSIAIPPLSCDPTVNHTKLWIYPESGNYNVQVTFPAAGSSDPLVTEMISYLELVAANYGGDGSG